MGSAQQFSLRWNNYSHHITNALDDLRAEDELTDVTLCADGSKIRAHKLLLSACSTFFRETFRENPCQHPVIILKGVSFTDLQAVVTFMYNGQVNVTQERLSCFLQTAEMLQIKGLTDMNDNRQDNHDQDGGFFRGLSNHSNSAAKKRIIGNSDSRLHNVANESLLQQRPPTPKRRKFVASAPAAAQGDAGSNAESAYNSPGPSAGGINHSGAGTVSMSNLDPNSVDPEDDYTEDVSAPAMLKYEQDDDGLGDEEDEYPNNLSEDGDNSTQDFTGMEQGAIDSNIDGGNMGFGGPPKGYDDPPSEEAEVVVLEGGYDIVTFSDPEDVSLMPTLSPVVSLSHSSSHQTYPIKVNLDPLSSTFRPMNKVPIPISTSTSHINILRRKRDPPELAEMVNPLAFDTGSSSRVNAKPLSPFVGDPMMDQETGETMFPCLMCDKKYKLRSSLESHVKVHEGSENTCSICGQTMSRQRDLKRHVATVHRGLLMPDGSITYPPDIEELVPMRVRKTRTKRPDGSEWVEHDPNNSNDYFSLENVEIKQAEIH